MIRRVFILDLHSLCLTFILAIFTDRFHNVSTWFAYVFGQMRSIEAVFLQVMWNCCFRPYAHSFDMQFHPVSCRIPAKVLKPGDWERSSNGPWRPQLGFNPNRQQVHLDQSAFRALGYVFTIIMTLLSVRHVIFSLCWLRHAADFPLQPDKLPIIVSSSTQLSSVKTSILIAWLLAPHNHV